MFAVIIARTWLDYLEVRVFHISSTLDMLTLWLSMISVGYAILAVPVAIAPQTFRPASAKSVAAYGSLPGILAMINQSIGMLVGWLGKGFLDDLEDTSTLALINDISLWETLLVALVTLTVATLVCEGAEWPARLASVRWGAESRAALSLALLHPFLLVALGLAVAAAWHIFIVVALGLTAFYLVSPLSPPPPCPPPLTPTH